MEDLASRGSTYAQNKDGATAVYFSTTVDPIASQVARNYLNVPEGPTQGAAFLREEVVEAYIAELPIVQYQAGLRPCELAVISHYAHSF